MQGIKRKANAAEKDQTAIPGSKAKKVDNLSPAR